MRTTHNRRQHSSVLFAVILAASSSCFASAAASSISLLDGEYMTTTDVSSWANLALDIRDMRAVDATQEEKFSRYSLGHNAQYIDGSGEQRIRSLASLSTGSYEVMKEDPMYGFFLSAFLGFGEDIEGEQSGRFDDHPVGEYANALVLDLFELRQGSTLDSDAALIYNVWMYVVHKLYEAQRACRQNDHKAMQAALDVAAALWIGSEQGYKDGTTGFMLYNLAERMTTYFHQLEESVANTLFIEALSDLKEKTDSKFCGTSDAYVEIRMVVRDMIGYMTIPLVQHMIHYLMQAASSKRDYYLRMYTLALAPRIAVCDPMTFETLMSRFVKQDFREASYQQSPVALLQSLYSCLQVTCDQVGNHRTDTTPECTQGQATTILAGYKAGSTDVIPFTRFDRDILQVEILVDVGAQDAALDYYQYGANVFMDGSLLSLQDLATSSTRRVASDQFDLFKEYFQDTNYAESIVLEVLTDQQVYGQKLSQLQTLIIISGTLRYMIMYMAVLEKVYTAIDGCGKDEPPELLIDEAVALYVGSVEGEAHNGRKGGRLMFGLSKSLCDNFKTCDKRAQNSKTNVGVLNAMRKTADQLKHGNCEIASRIAESEIAPLLLVTLLQGTLFLAFKTLAVSGTLQNPDMAAANAYIYSLSVLPLMQNVDKGQASTIAERLELGHTSTPQDKFDVLKAFKTIIPEMKIPNLQSHCDAMGEFFGERFSDYCEDTMEIEDEGEQSMQESLGNQQSKEAVSPSSEQEGGKDSFGFLGTFIIGAIVGVVGAVSVALWRRYAKHRQDVQAYEQQFEDFELISTREGVQLT